MKTLLVGIASYEDMKERTLALARGDRPRAESEPKVWFTSLGSFAKVLSEKNQALLALIAREQPESLSELTALSGRHKSNLSRTLKTMAQYGLVDIEEGARGRIVPRVRYERVRLELDFGVDAARRKMVP